jgi:hypothetical protein
MNETEPEYFWHFVQVDGEGTPRLGYGDNREVKVGETLRVEGTPTLCHHGLHASFKLWDALGYAQGEKLSLCRVTLGGEADHDSDKSVANERTVVAMLDADATDKLLRDFSRWCALQVIHLWDAPDVVRQYLETGDESLRSAARSAAESAARSAAESAARSAARSAAWSAAESAAWSAAESAAESAAWSAAESAAESAARSAEIEECAAELERRAIVAMGGK